MKRLLLCFSLFLCPSIVAAEEVVIGHESIETCHDVTYLAAVDVTIGENCLRTTQSVTERSFFVDDDITAALHASWAMPYTLNAPTYAPIQTQTLAILDTGFSTTNPWLQSFVTKTYNVTNDSESIPDTASHGTAVATAAILAMHQAPVDVLLIKIDQNGQLSIANIVKGLNYAIEQGAQVINMSLGGTSPDEAEAHAVQAALRANITVVAAAGNNGNKGNAPHYPASYDGVLSIGAINAQQMRAPFSNFNDTLTLMAPGEAVPLLYQQKVQPINGTSFASPFAAATIAAVQQYTDVSTDLLHTGFIQQADDILTRGYDVESGYGIINGNRTLSWLRGDIMPLHTISNRSVTITFSKAVASNTSISLYANGQLIDATTTVHNDTVTVTPHTIVPNVVYTLKIDRDVYSASGEALTQPLYVPMTFHVSP